MGRCFDEQIHKAFYLIGLYIFKVGRYLRCKTPPLQYRLVLFIGSILCTIICGLGFLWIDEQVQTFLFEHISLFRLQKTPNLSFLQPELLGDMKETYVMPINRII